MDDYMYHDYDGADVDSPKKAKRKKIMSIIGTIICLSWFAGIGVFLLVRHTDNIRTDYPEIKLNSISAAQNIAPSDKNEFVQLRMELESKGKIIPNSEFFEKYPDLKKVFDINSAQQKGGCILHYESDGYITMVEPYVDYQAKQDATKTNFIGILGADFLMMPYEISNGELKIGSPERFCVKYDMSNDQGVASVSLKEFVSTSFRLNFYNLSVIVEGSGKIENTLRLKEYPTKWECDNRKIADNLTADGQKLEITGGNEPTDKHIDLTAKSTGKTLLKLNFDKLLYRKYESWKIGVNEPEKTKFTIVINEGVK